MTISSRILLTLMCLPKIGPTTAKKIFEDLEFNDRPFNDFIGIIENAHLNLKAPAFEKGDIKKAIDQVEKIGAMSDKAGIKIISIFDNDYPQQLKRLKKPPVIINYIGDLSILKENRNCAVIGTRNPTAHGYEYGVRISKKMAENHLVIVSGLAVGCDTAGHKGSIAGNGKTAAVLAQGLNLDKVYPKVNRGLAKEILNTGGLLISEYTIDQPAKQNFFVERDRIQAGLSDFLFVVETGIKGGTWHTINFAMECKVPIATYKHPDKYKQLEQTLGNQKLIIENKATGIHSLDDFNSFLTSVYKDHLKTWRLEHQGSYSIDLRPIPSTSDYDGQWVFFDTQSKYNPPENINEPKPLDYKDILDKMKGKSTKRKSSKKKDKDSGSGQSSLF